MTNDIVLYSDLLKIVVVFGNFPLKCLGKLKYNFCKVLTTKHRKRMQLLCIQITRSRHFKIKFLPLNEYFIHCECDG